jgi:hypothetical protein
MDKTLGRIAFEAWLNVPVSDEWWHERAEHARQQWEYVAAAVAAEVRKERGWRPIEEAPGDEALLVGAWNEYAQWCIDWPQLKPWAIDKGYTHYLPQPQPDPPPQEPKP